MNVAAEVLEIRVVPACIPPGTYTDPLGDETSDVLEVFGGAKKNKGFGTYEYRPDDGGESVKFGVKLSCKKDKIISDSKGITFEVEIKDSVGGIRLVGKFKKGKDGPTVNIDESMSPTSN